MRAHLHLTLVLCTLSASHALATCPSGFHPTGYEEVTETTAAGTTTQRKEICGEDVVAKAPACPTGWYPGATEHSLADGKVVTKVTCEEEQSLEFSLPLVMDVYGTSETTHAWQLAQITPADGSAAPVNSYYLRAVKTPAFDVGASLVPGVKHRFSHDAITGWVGVGVGISVAGLGTTDLGRRLTLRLMGGYGPLVFSLGGGLARATEITDPMIVGALYKGKLAEAPALTTNPSWAGVWSVSIGFDVADATSLVASALGVLTATLAGK